MNSQIMQEHEKNADGKPTGDVPASIAKMWDVWVVQSKKLNLQTHCLGYPGLADTMLF